MSNVQYIIFILLPIFSIKKKYTPATCCYDIEFLGTLFFSFKDGVHVSPETGAIE